MEHPQETMVFTTGCPALWETASASWLQKLFLLDVPKLIAWDLTGFRWYKNVEILQFDNPQATRQISCLLGDSIQCSAVVLNMQEGEPR